jgi:hypothetical protein
VKDYTSWLAASLHCESNRCRLSPDVRDDHTGGPC